MYEYIKGNITFSGSDYVVVENGGIGYRILTSLYSIESFIKSGEDITCYTELIVREDAMLLVGFSTRDELTLFHKLTSVSGVGTKVAIALLSHASYLEVSRMILTGDVKGLTAAPGIGKKTAERIVLELKDKVDNFGGMVVEDVSFEVETTSYQDAVEALIALGYVKADAQKALKGLDFEGLTTEMALKYALKKMMGL